MARFVPVELSSDPAVVLGELEARDAASAIAEVAAYARLPDPEPAPGSGWIAFSYALRIAHGQAADVIEKVIGAVPEAAEVGQADVDTVIDAVGVSARAMADELRASSVIALFTGPAMLRAGKLALCKGLVALWISVEKGMPVYRGNEAGAAAILGKLSQDDRIADYRIRLGTAQALKRFASSGALDQVLSATSTEGRRTAGWPIVIVAIVLAVVALVWALLEHQRLSRINALIDAMCLNPDGSLKAGVDPKLCAELGKSMRGPSLIDSTTGWAAYAMPALGAAALLALVLAAKR